MLHPNRLPAFFTAGAVALCLASCSTAPAPAEAPPPALDMAALTTQIQGMEDAYATASKAKDANAVVAYYADDVVSYSREKEPARGKEALRQRLAEGMAKDTLGTTLSKIMIPLLEDLPVERCLDAGKKFVRLPQFDSNPAKLFSHLLGKQDWVSPWVVN